MDSASLNILINKICDENFKDHNGNTIYPNTRQRMAVEKSVLKKKNIALIGPPGTGKTFTTNLIDKVLHIVYPNIRFARTATTGMASTHLTSDSGDAKTFYNFLCSGSVSMISHREEFKDKLINDKRCQDAFTNTDVLQIDEASLLGETTMSHMECAARIARKPCRQYMGGMQVLLVGDIHQLGTIDVAPGGGHDRDGIPIPIQGILDNLPDSFEVVILTDLMRSSEDTLHQEVLKGLVSIDVLIREEALKMLNRICCKSMISEWEVLQTSNPGSTVITYSNRQVDFYNLLRRRMYEKENPSGPISIGVARKLHTWDTLSREDKKSLKDEEGLQREEREIIKRASFITDLRLYPNELCLLRRNTDTYKNGDTVIFLGVEEKEHGKVLKVRRLSDNRTLLIEPMDHTSEYVNKVGYEQYPIISKPAVTIHKIQGSTLEEVTFDPTYLNSSGKDAARLIYTAASRTRNLKSLRLTAAIATEILTNEVVQKELATLWSLEYMADYPTTTLEKLRTAYAEYVKINV
jgi:hypothetical protein